MAQDKTIRVMDEQHAESLRAVLARRGSDVAVEVAHPLDRKHHRAQREAYPERWVERRIGRWVASYRIVQQGERFVVAEVRVFPDHWEPGTPRPAGRWSATYGAKVDKTDAVPIGGLSAAVLRDASRLREAYSSAREDRWTDWDAFMDGSVEPPPKRRRDALSLNQLAQLALAYADACAKGSRSPVQDVATRVGEKATTIRGRIALARQRGVLTEPFGGQGVSGGRLTPLGESLLTAAERSKRKRDASSARPSRPAPPRRGRTKR
jgi:hypothetical protein